NNAYGAVVWNPWLGQSTWIEPSLIHSGMGFDGIGYDNNNYKIAASSPGNEDDLWTTYDFPSDVWTDHDSEPDDQTVTYTKPSYFIQDKRLVVCSCDNTGHAWIYILGDNKLISKTRIDCVVDPWPLHCTFVPSLVPVPARCRREERAELHV
ncbi:unnamed protein product, partial [Arabidopsis halleri]